MGWDDIHRTSSAVSRPCPTAPPSAGEAAHARAARPCGTSRMTSRSAGRTSRSATCAELSRRGRAADRRSARARAAPMRRRSWRSITSFSSSGPHVGDLDALLAGGSQRHGGLERGLHRAAPGERATAIADPRQESLLERVRQMQPVGERAAPRARTPPARAWPGCSSPRDPRAAAGSGAPAAAARAWLARPAPPPRPDQARPSAARRRGRGRPSRTRLAGSISGRHMGMSRATTRTPPSQLRGALPPDARAGAATRGAMSLTDRLHALDRRQQRRPSGCASSPPSSRSSATTRPASSAALIAYYGFVSLFPLLLVFVTILGFVLQGNPDAQHRDPRRHARPVPDHQRPAAELHSLNGSGVALAIGLDRLAARRPRHHQRHPERLQPDLERALQAPPQLPHRAAARPRHARDPRHARRSSRRPPPASSAPPATGALAVVGGVLVAFAFNLRCS